MNGPLGVSGGLDPLPGSVVGAGLTAAGSLIWPELSAGVLSLAVLATVVVWIRVVRSVRTRGTTGYDLRRLVPVGVAAAGGWAGVLVVGALVPSLRVWSLVGVAMALWPASQMAGVSS